jgi:ELWxxDGT repeat protein
MSNTWVTDGSSLNTEMIGDTDKRICSIQGNRIIQIGSNYYFKIYTAASGNEIGIYNPTSGIAQVLKEINPASGDASVSVPIINADNNKFYFTGVESESTGIYQSNGTSLGTELMSDFEVSGSLGSNPSDFYGVGDSIYFDASSDNGSGVWKFSTSATAPKLIKNLSVNQEYSVASEFIAFKKKVFFRGIEDTSGNELWSTDGTSQGTNLAFDYVSGSGGLGPNGMAVFKNKLYFAGVSSSAGIELFESDGSLAGTKILRDLNSGAEHSYPADISLLKNGFLFKAKFSAEGFEPGVSDGTSAGTKILKDIFPGAGDSNPSNFIKFKDKYFFSAADALGNYELWSSNGSTNGTQKLVEINPGATGSNPKPLIVFKGRLYFTAEHPSLGKEIWSTDGTSAGTSLLKDINAGVDGSSITQAVIFRKRLYFMADDGVHGRELWQSDGSATGTVIFDDITPGTEGTYSTELISVGDRLLNHSYSSENGYILYSYNRSFLREIFYAPSTGNSLSGLSWLKYYRGRLVAGTSLSNTGIELMSYLSTDGEALGKLDKLIARLKKAKLKKLKIKLPGIKKAYFASRKFITKKKRILSIQKFNKVKKIYTKVESAFLNLENVSKARNKKALISRLNLLVKAIDWELKYLQK